MNDSSTLWVEDVRELERRHAAAPALLSFGLSPSASEFYELVHRLLPQILEAYDEAKGDAAVNFALLSSACVVGEECCLHGGVHGGEAAELRAGVEQILRNTAAVRSEEAPSVLEDLRKALQFLLEHTDPFDSQLYQKAAVEEGD